MSDNLKSWSAKLAKTQRQSEESFQRLMRDKPLAKHQSEESFRRVMSQGPNRNRDADATMWAGILMIILGIPLSIVLIGIPMIIVGFFVMIYGGAIKRRD